MNIQIGQKRDRKKLTLRLGKTHISNFGVLDKKREKDWRREQREVKVLVGNCVSLSLKILYQLITFIIAWTSFSSLINQDSVWCVQGMGHIRLFANVERRKLFRECFSKIFSIISNVIPASVKNLASLWPLFRTANWAYLKSKYIIWSYTLLKILKLSNHTA